MSSNDVSSVVEKGRGVHFVDAAMSRTANVAGFAARWVVIVFLIATGLLTLVVTAYLPYYTYRIVFSFRPFLPVLVSIIIVLIALSISERYGVLRSCNPRKLSRILVIYMAIFGSFWMVLARAWPEWDSAEVLSAARTMRDADLWYFTDAGYFIRFPYQIPFLYFDRLMINTFGDSAYQAIELINIICCIFTAIFSIKLTKAYFNDNRIVNITIFLYFAFFPILFYVTFAYPNVLCFPFLMGSLLGQALHIKTKKISYAVLSIFSAIICVTLKSSMVVLIVALTIVWLLVAMKKRIISMALCAICLLFGYIGAGQAMNYVSKAALDIDSSQALPKSVWIAMGLQANGPKMPENFGWYNGYPWSWTADEYDPSRIDIEAKSLIHETVRKFVEDPPCAFTFFSKKYASEWAEPTFESLLASNWSKTRDIPGAPILSQRPMTRPLHSIYYGRPNKVLTFIMDVWQTIILLGAAAALIRIAKGPTIQFLAPGLFAFGTAILFLFWEAQSQYILPAYVALVPYAGAGIVSMTDILRSRIWPLIVSSFGMFKRILPRVL